MLASGVGSRSDLGEGRLQEELELFGVSLDILPDLVVQAWVNA